MKTASLTYPTHRFIDTAPLVARFDILTKALLVLIETGRGREMLRYSQKVMRVIRVFNRLDRDNHLLARKLDMLTNKPWRECVLRELGGLRKLKLWEAARKRIIERSAARAKAPVRPIAPENSIENPAWLYTPARIAESERLKAWARKCSRASAHPLIFRDPCKMDFEGEFRLAPLPRGDRAAGQVQVYTQASISDYSWNPIPFGEVKGFGPAVVWPVEFHAAAKLEAEILEGREGPSLITLAERRPLLDPRGREGDKGENIKRDDKQMAETVNRKQRAHNEPCESLNTAHTPSLPLHVALPRKIYRAIFDP